MKRFDFLKTLTIPFVLPLLPKSKSTDDAEIIKERFKPNSNQMSAITGMSISSACYVYDMNDLPTGVDINQAVQILRKAIPVDNLMI